MYTQTFFQKFRVPSHSNIPLPLISHLFRNALAILLRDAYHLRSDIPDQDGIAFLMTGIICRILTATAEIRKIAIVPKIRYLMLVIGNI